MLYCSLVSTRRIARLLSINRKTVARKVDSMGLLALKRQSEYLQERQEKGEVIRELQFDEMESFVHTKCLPVSIPLIVEEGTRKILGFRVCSMPAKGPLAVIALKKYGPRADHRKIAAQSLFTELAPLIASDAKITTDQKSAYPRWFRPYLPKANHIAIKGRRGCVVGQGELKKIGRDPIFDFNHTAAMIRANVNRLIRRTWCTTKRMDRLVAHVALYMEYHNFVLTQKS